MKYLYLSLLLFFVAGCLHQKNDSNLSSNSSEQKSNQKPTHRDIEDTDTIFVAGVAEIDFSYFLSELGEEIESIDLSFAKRCVSISVPKSNLSTAIKTLKKELPKYRCSVTISDSINNPTSRIWKEYKYSQKELEVREKIISLREQLLYSVVWPDDEIDEKTMNLMKKELEKQEVNYFQQRVNGVFKHGIVKYQRIEYKP